MGADLGLDWIELDWIIESICMYPTGVVFRFGPIWVTLQNRQALIGSWIEIRVPMPALCLSPGLCFSALIGSGFWSRMIRHG